MAELSTEELQTYLDELRATGSRVKARQKIRRQRNTIDAVRLADEQFREAELEAQEEADDALEQEARRRAVEGVEEQVFDKDGKVSGYRTKHSDTLLIFMMKGAMPDKYAERSKSEITGKGGAPLIDDTAAAARLAGILDAARQRKEGGDNG